MSRVLCHGRNWLLGLALLALSFAVWARDAAPIVRVDVAARQPVMVGQQIRIEVTILAPNFFMSAPSFPTLQIPGAIVTLPDERGELSTETIDGKTYASIRKAYLFAAEQGGDFQLPPVTIAFTYAGDDGAARQGSVTLPPTRISTAMPAGAAARAPAVAPPGAVLPVARLAVTQAFDRPVSGESAHFRAGDALVRTVTTFAPQTQAMMIRPPHIEAPHGVRAFSGDPRLSDQAQGSDGQAGGSRVDRITYVFEHVGTYTLPAVTVDWLDPATGKPGRSEAPAVKIEVGAALSIAGLAPGGPPAAALPGETSSHWRVWLWAGGVLIAALLAWRLLQRLRPWIARWRKAIAERRRARASGAKARFDAVMQACRAGDAPAAYRALGAWTRTAFGKAPSAWAAGTGDAALNQAVEALERRLFEAGTTQWDGTALSRSLLRHAPARDGRRRHAPPAVALPPLNP